MCRWLAYTGSPITVDTVVTRPNHSLVDQSLLARQLYLRGSAMTAQFRRHDLPSNGDGFGLGWYDHRGRPARYRDIRPAWNDANLHRLAQQVESGTFLAHVRAASAGGVSRLNCHPFRHGRWLFVHNGGIGGYDTMRRDLLTAVDRALFPFIEGTSDSEVAFFLALSSGLEDDPPQALRRMVGRIEQARAEHGVTEQFRATMCATDGSRLYALRYASTVADYVAAPTLYHSAGPEHLRVDDDETLVLPADAQLVASEPLELHYSPRTWVEVPDGSLLTVSRGQVATIEALDPTA